MASLLLSTARVVAITATVVLCAYGISRAQNSAAHSGAGAETQHTLISPASVKWNPVNTSMSISVLSGSPDIEGAPFVMRLKLADGARVPPHWHPVDEHVTVVRGTFHMGTGPTFDKSTAKAMPSGSYCIMPREVRHFGWATGETVVQIHGIGPFKTFFVETTIP